VELDKTNAPRLSFNRLVQKSTSDDRLAGSTSVKLEIRDKTTVSSRVHRVRRSNERLSADSGKH